MAADEVQTDTEKKKGAGRQLSQPWFVAAVSPSGAIVKKSAATPSAFAEVLGSSVIAWVDYVTDDTELDKVNLDPAIELGFSQQLVASMTLDDHVNYQDFDVEMGMKFPSIQVRQFKVQSHELLVLIKKNLILTAHPPSVSRRFIKLRRYAETVLKKIPLDINPNDKLTLFIMRIVDINNDRNFEHLREIEERGDELNSVMTDPFTPREKIGPKIYEMKHALITYLNALWDSVDVLHTLRYGDAELITDDEKLLQRLGILAEDVNRQIGLAEHLSEVLASGLEVLQSIYNNQLQNLNNRLALLMTYLTIIGTAVLVPNTLATILGNSVFDIGPKDLWWYLLLMIGSTVGATAVVYWWVKKSGWIPRKMD